MAKKLNIENISPSERLIVALDVHSIEEAHKMIAELGDDVKFYKIGLELFMQNKGFELIQSLREMGKHIFTDLKFYDVPRTVTAAVRQLIKYDVDFITVHGDNKIMEAAVKAKQKTSKTKILAVTVLTSLDEYDIKDLGFDGSLEDLVLSRAEQAVKLGCDGVIASGLEAKQLRKEIPKDDMIIVTPGIRPPGSKGTDQKRTVNVKTAFESGADFIVVGRAITKSQKRKEVVQKIQEEIKKFYTVPPLLNLNKDDKIKTKATTQYSGRSEPVALAALDSSNT